MRHLEAVWTWRPPMMAKASLLFPILWQKQDSSNYGHGSSVSELPSVESSLKTPIPGPITNLLYYNLSVCDPGIRISNNFSQMTLMSTDI